jgi:hypothetical protein
MPTTAKENARLQLLKALGQQPGVSAWFSVWQLERLGRPAVEVWRGASPERRGPKSPKGVQTA